jgi:hypothetical protein
MRPFDDAVRLPDRAVRHDDAVRPHEGDLRGRCLLKETDLTRADFLALVSLGDHLRAER